MAHDDKVRNQLHTKYLQGMPLTTAAEARKVSYQTARNFKRSAQEAGDDWDIAYGADLPGQHALSCRSRDPI